MVFPHPHKFCQIARMQTFLDPIPRHSNFSMPPVTFYPVCTGIIVCINEFFGMVDSYMFVTYFIEFTVSLPTVTVYN